LAILRFRDLIDDFTIGDLIADLIECRHCNPHSTIRNPIRSKQSAIRNHQCNRHSAVANLHW
jgi:hypothetical protein